MNDSELSENPTLGTLVRTGDSFGNNPPGSLGIVYYIEEDDGVIYSSVLLENGDDIGAFNPIEVSMDLIVESHHALDYSYQGITKLLADYQAGVFTPFFQMAQPNE